VLGKASRLYPPNNLKLEGQLHRLTSSEVRTPNPEVARVDKQLPAQARRTVRLPGASTGQVPDPYSTSPGLAPLDSQFVILELLLLAPPV